MMNKRLIVIGFGILLFSIKLDISDLIYLDERISIPLSLLGLAFIIIGAMNKD